MNERYEKYFERLFVAGRTNPVRVKLTILKV